MYTMKIGRLKVNVQGIEDASRQYQMIRDEAEANGEDAIPQGEFRMGGDEYRVSYNGRVWHLGRVVMNAIDLGFDQFDNAYIIESIRDYVEDQKTNPPTTDKWQRASRELKLLYAEMAKRDPEGKLVVQLLGAR